MEKIVSVVYIFEDKIFFEQIIEYKENLWFVVVLRCFESELLFGDEDIRISVVLMECLVSEHNCFERAVVAFKRNLKNILKFLQTCTKQPVH